MRDSSDWTVKLRGGGGGALKWQKGYRARPGTHKKHPKHVFLGLKFASLNKYIAVGFDTLNNDFSF